jgi:hypothetical protein
LELSNQLILLGAFLLLLSIFVGLVSSRIGAPLLLAFLALGMFFGGDGPGSIYFDNYQSAFIIAASRSPSSCSTAGCAPTSAISAWRPGPRSCWRASGWS